MSVSPHESASYGADSYPVGEGLRGASELLFAGMVALPLDMLARFSSNESLPGDTNKPPEKPVDLKKLIPPEPQMPQIWQSFPRLRTAEQPRSNEYRKPAFDPNRPLGLLAITPFIETGQVIEPQEGPVASIDVPSGEISAGLSELSSSAGIGDGGGFGDIGGGDEFE